MAPGRTINSQLFKNDASILTPRNPGHPYRLFDPVYLPYVRKREYYCEQGPPGSFQGSTGCLLQALQNPLNRPDTGQGLLSRTVPVSPVSSGFCVPAFPEIFMVPTHHTIRPDNQYYHNTNSFDNRSPPNRTPETGRSCHLRNFFA